MDSPPSRHGSSPPPPAATGPLVFGFGDFEFDEERWELRDKGVGVDVPPKVMQTLALLLRNRERVVATEELLDALWPSVTVTEASLTKAIRIARQVLNDDGEAQRCIKTTRGRGYRFVAEVIERPAGRRPTAAALPSDRAAATALSARPLLPAGDEPFVGREADLAELYAVLERARAGRPSFLLVSGDAGVGKTRLLEEFGRVAEGSGVRVIWGRSWEEGGAPDLWPWIQILRGLLTPYGALGPSDLAEVARVLATMLESEDRESSPSRSGPERFRAFDAVVGVLSRAGRIAPLVLVLEDLHSADASTLILTHLLAREIRDAGVVVIGTYRPGDLDADPRVTEPFKKLLRGARLLPLGGLSEDSTRLLLGAMQGSAPDLELLSRVQRVTEGNPLFVVEIARHLAAVTTDRQVRTEAELEIPERIVEAVRGRFDALSMRTRELLSAASVIGRQFELPVLQRVAELGADEAAALLEPALSRGIVTAVKGSLGSYAFSHMLLRDVLYEDLGIAQRAALHRKIGHALEATGAPGAELPAARLAHHFLRAALGAGSEKAVTYSAAAGRQALRSFAFEEAVRHFEHALEALHFAEGKERLSTDLLLALGRAQRLSGEYAVSRATLDRALSLARTLGDPVRVARVALDYGEVKPESGTVNQELLSLLEEAATRLAEPSRGDDPEVRELLSLVDARLATCVSFAGRREEGEARSQRALDLARSIGRPQVLAHALHARHWLLWRPGTARERLAIASEMVGLGRGGEEGLPAMEARLCEVTDLLELGEAGALWRALARYERAAQSLRDPSALYNVRVFGTMRAILEGRFAEAERMAEEALPIGSRIHPENARTFYGVQLWWIRVEQGRGAGVVTVFRERVDGEPDHVLLRAGLLRLYVEANEHERARVELEHLSVGDFAPLPSDWALLPTLAHVAVACAALGDVRRAALVRRLLLPHVDSHVVVGPAIVYLGPVSFYVGLLSTALGAFDDAISELERALADGNRMGGRPVVSRIQLALGEALFRRARPGDAERAASATRAAGALARELGMTVVEERAGSRLSEVSAAPGARADE